MMLRFDDSQVILQAGWDRVLQVRTRLFVCSVGSLRSTLPHPHGYLCSIVILFIRSQMHSRELPVSIQIRSRHRDLQALPLVIQ